MRKANECKSISDRWISSSQSNERENKKPKKECKAIKIALAHGNLVNILYYCMDCFCNIAFRMHLAHILPFVFAVDK